MKLYYSRNLNPRVAVAVARYLGSPVDYIAANPRDADQEEAFRPINPNTLVPVLVEDDRSLWETDAIACRLSQIAGSARHSHGSAKRPSRASPSSRAACDAGSRSPGR